MIHIKYEPHRMRYVIYNVYPELGKALASGGQLVDWEPTLEAPIWLTLSEEEYEHLFAAMQGRPAPRGSATQRHLDDAIAVRDRLLTLVEQS